MLKMFVFWLLLQPPYPHAFQERHPTTVGCLCPPVTDLQKTGETGDSFSFSWTGPDAADYFRLWYVRQEDSYTSTYVTITATDYTFTDLPSGHYTFYVTAVCGGEPSSFLGLEDLIEN